MIEIMRIIFYGNSIENQRHIEIQTDEDMFRQEPIETEFRLELKCYFFYTIIIIKIILSIPLKERKYTESKAKARPKDISVNV